MSSKLECSRSVSKRDVTVAYDEKSNKLRKATEPITISNMLGSATVPAKP